MKSINDKILETSQNRRKDFSAHLFAEEFNNYETITDEGDEVYSSRVESQWLESWICTDTMVGVKAFFLDNELICITTQMGRKCDTFYHWVSKEAFDKMKAFILSLPTETDIYEPEIDLIDINKPWTWLTTNK